MLVEMDGCRLVTDPVLTQRLLHLRRHAPVPPALGALDAVLISHAHPDHLHFRSLRRIGRDCRVIAPRGCGRLMHRHGFHHVEELDVGETTQAGTVTVRAIPTDHHTRRLPLARTSLSVGFALEGACHIAFLGDTDLFDEMTYLGTGIDAALVPVWGWGPRIGTGHLDPGRAAEAMQLLRPRIAIPIHWATLAPLTQRGRPEFLDWPGPEFARAAARVAPDVEVRVLAPGESTEVGAHDR